MSNYITCPNCSQQNYASEQFCTNCGLWLQDFETRKTFAGNQGTVIKAQVQQIIQEREPQFKTIPQLEPGEIALAIEDNANLLVLKFGQTIVLGRDTGQRTETDPLVDFNDYRGYVMGVSRKHAIIFREGETF